MERAVLLYDDQEMITVTQTSDDVMQACPSDMMFLQELQLLDNIAENKEGAATYTDDVISPLQEKDMSVKHHCCLLSEKFGKLVSTWLKTRARWCRKSGTIVELTES